MVKRKIPPPPNKFNDTRQAPKLTMYNDNRSFYNRHNLKGKSTRFKAGAKRAGGWSHRTGKTLFAWGKKGYGEARRRRFRF